jgi:MFS family permease
MAKKGYEKIISWSFPFEALNRDLKLIFASNLVGAFGDGLFAYLLPYYMAKNLNANSVEIGILYAVFSLVAASTLLLAGKFADTHDRKKIMIIGWIMWLPAPLIFSFAGNWLQMLPGMVLWGFWLGGPTSTAYIVTAADKSRLTVTFTTMSAAWSLGYIFSPALGGFLARAIGVRFIFYLGFIFYALAAFTLVFIRSQNAVDSTLKAPKEDYSFFKLLRTAKLLKLSIFFASMMFFLMMFRPFIPEFLGDKYHYGDFEIGVLGSVSFFGSALLGILLGRLGDRWKKSYALSASMVLCSFPLILLLLCGNFYVLTITFFLAGGSYITWSLMSAIIGPMAPESMRARWISVPQTVTMFSSFIAPYIGGVLYGVSPYYPFIIAIVATAILAPLSLSKLFEKE